MGTAALEIERGESRNTLHRALQRNGQFPVGRLAKQGWGKTIQTALQTALRMFVADIDNMIGAAK